MSVMDVAPHEPLMRLTFGVGGNAAGCQLDGWSVPEARFCWAVGKQARLLVTCPQGAAGLALELRVRPMVFLPRVPAQHLRVLVNGVTAGEATVAVDSTIAFAVPADALASELLVTLYQPNATAPVSVGANSDARVLGVAVEEITLWPALPASAPQVARPPLPPAGMRLDDAVRGVTGLDPARMIAHFESLGQNCDFGLAQQEVGVERLSLLRFAGIHQAGLLRGLADGFSHLLNVDEYRIANYGNDPNSEYCVEIDHYFAQFHTAMTPAHATRADVLAYMPRYFAFIRRKLMETLQEADTLFVLQDDHVRQDCDALPVLYALRRYGNNALLYVVTGDAFPHGTVEQRSDGLYRGWRKLSYEPGRNENVDVPLWLSLCANAYRFWRASGRGKDW